MQAVIYYYDVDLENRSHLPHIKTVEETVKAIEKTLGVEVIPVPFNGCSTIAVIEVG